LTGIIDAHEFRNRIIEAREALRAQRSGHAVAGAATGSVPTDALERIVTRLDEIAALLRDRRGA
ncbi:MAG: hypothetical protein EBR71_08895, partial [Planctomycetes bacterium]|nr:hypothetical protein [Planctomycetota bacterium]